MQTDSYIAVQLLEQKKSLDFDSLRYMAEQVEGSFSFTVLDEQSALWIVKGDSPLSIAYFPERGVYVYASTVEILNKALTRCGKQLGHRRMVEVEMGDLLKIDRRGHITARHSIRPNSADRLGIIGGHRCTPNRRKRRTSIFVC